VIEDRLVSTALLGEYCNFHFNQARSADRGQHLSQEHFSPFSPLAEKYMTNIVHWNELDRGGHFAAWEQP
jgi:hypothetical protein